MKKYIALALSIFITIISTTAVYAANSNVEYSWYCKRQPDGKRPSIAPEFAFIEDYDGYWIDNKVTDNSENKFIYLTFDAGYENGNVEKILNTLKEKDAPAAFFVLKHFVTSNQELIERMIREGHTICNHTSNHKNMSKIKKIEIFKKELEELEQVYYNQTGNHIAKIYRPPEGSFTELNLQFAKELGYTTLFWSVAYADWNNNAQPSPEFAKKKILDNIHNGAVILLHPTSATNALILDDLIDEIRNRGYEIKSIENLFI